MLSEKIISFYKGLEIPKVSRGIEVMNPYQDEYALGLCNLFYRKYYSDNQPRTLMLGINPGRFGSGTTGISFTDPVKLQDHCGIMNTLSKKAELSADFIYLMINAFGGPTTFYKKFFISAVSPLGFTKGGKNINYYDDRKLEESVLKFITKSLNQLIAMGMGRKKCFCIGEGENFKFLSRLNAEHKWFNEIVPLPHPRFIMQYRRKKVDQYIAAYLKELM